MLLSIVSRGEYEIPTDTFLHLMIEPPLQGCAHTIKEETLHTSATSFSELWLDHRGNPQRRFEVPQGLFSFEFRATVDVVPNTLLPAKLEEMAPRDIPAEVMQYTLPSRYCQSDKLGRMAADEFGKLPPGGKRIRQIASWIRRHVEYSYGTTNGLTSASDTATERIGVCRDFAHLLIAFCRALNIPARYVAGYALELDPQDFHGYAQVYLGDAWHNVDATFADARPALVPIAVGRDAADVAMMTFFGTATMLSQSVEVTRLS